MSSSDPISGPHSPLAARRHACLGLGASDSLRFSICGASAASVGALGAVEPFQTSSNTRNGRGGSAGVCSFACRRCRRRTLTLGRGRNGGTHCGPPDGLEHECWKLGGRSHRRRIEFAAIAVIALVNRWGSWGSEPYPRPTVNGEAENMRPGLGTVRRGR